MVCLLFTDDIFWCRGFCFGDRLFYLRFPLTSVYYPQLPTDNTFFI